MRETVIISQRLKILKEGLPVGNRFAQQQIGPAEQFSHGMEKKNRFNVIRKLERCFSQPHMHS